MDALTKVLLVDDDADIRALCRGLLEREGYAVAEAVDGLDALDKIKHDTPDVIIMDVVMPNMGGLECARRLKADPATRSIPIIMASVLSAEEDIIAGLEAGVDEYITKPIRRREFVLRVRSMARLRRGISELAASNEVRGEQARMLTLLLDFSQALVAVHDLDTVLDRAVRVAAQLTCSRRVSIMLPDADDKVLTIAKAIGIDERTAAGIRVPVGAATAGQVFLSGQPMVVNTAAGAKRLGDRYDSAFFVSAPLMSSALSALERVVGVLNITERQGGRPFEPHELAYVDLICNIAATAIDDIATRRARDEAQDCIVVALATLAEYRDDDAAEHLGRVTVFSRILAEELRTAEPFRGRIDERFLSDLRRAVPLHDIGKVAIADRILLKPGALTAQEMAIMKTHAEIGTEAIRSVIRRVPGVGFLEMAAEIACGHHEWYDGSGYPRGLRGDEIPLAARIVALADVYDALTTKRVYKDAVSHEEAVAIIRGASGSQFDPAVVGAFLKRHHEFARLAARLADRRVPGTRRRSEPVADRAASQTPAPAPAEASSRVAPAASATAS